MKEIACLQEVVLLVDLKGESSHCLDSQIQNVCLTSPLNFKHIFPSLTDHHTFLLVVSLDHVFILCETEV